MLKVGIWYERKQTLSSIPAFAFYPLMKLEIKSKLKILAREIWLCDIFIPWNRWK